MVTVTNIKKRNVGDQVKVTATLASAANNETWIVPHISNIEGPVEIRPTTDDTLNCTTSGNTVTFKTGGSLAADIAVWGR